MPAGYVPPSYSVPDEKPTSEEPTSHENSINPPEKNTGSLFSIRNILKKADTGDLILFAVCALLLFDGEGTGFEKENDIMILLILAVLFL